MFTTQRPKVMSWASHSSHHVRMWDGYRMPYFFFFLVAMQVVKVALVVMGLSFRKSLDIHQSDFKRIRRKSYGHTVGLVFLFKTREDD